MKNFIFLSPNFPTNYWHFCHELKKNGLNVLGIGEQAYDELLPELKDSLNEYYKVNSLENYDEVYRAVAFLTFKHGRIDWLESNNEYWLERDAKLRTDFNITSGFHTEDIPRIKFKSGMKGYYQKAGLPVARYYLVADWDGCINFINEVGYPVVAKPDNGVGASDTHKIKCEEDLATFFSKKIDGIQYIMEEFVNAEVQTYDAIIGANGEPLFETGNVSFMSIMDIVNNKDNSFFYIQKDLPEDIREAGRKTVKSFGVETRIVDICHGPTVTRYELQPCAGVKISRITALADDIALNLAAGNVRIEAPIPNKAAVGIEVPNKEKNTVTIREILESPEFTSAKSKLTVALGKDISGNIITTDIAKMPHGLIAGATGSGKSVCTNSIIISLLYKNSPDELKLLLIDPKTVEFEPYNGIPHLLVPVVTDPRKAAGALGWAVSEMEKRYKMLSDRKVRNVEEYNEFVESFPDEGIEKLPHIVIIIDELADLMQTASKEVEDSIARLAAKARAAGLHMILATQRPSVDVITGVIKANIPTRIALTCSSQIDSRTIIDAAGAEKLLGRGDMLFDPVGTTKPRRLQGCFVSNEEIKSVVDFVKGDRQANYDSDVMFEIERQAAIEKKQKTGLDEDGPSDDPMIKDAIRVVVENGMASTSLLQRKLKLGYARAARIVDEMEARGVVGPYEGSKPRKVLITPDQLAEMELSSDE